MSLATQSSSAGKNPLGIPWVLRYEKPLVATDRCPLHSSLRAYARGNSRDTHRSEI
jgi:hypothetical protein